MATATNVVQMGRRKVDVVKRLTKGKEEKQSNEDTDGTESIEDEKQIAVAAPKVVWDAVQIKDWCRYYASIKNMQNYLNDTYETNRNSTLAKNQEPYTATKAELALLAHKPAEFIASHGRLYRWKFQYEEALATEEEAFVVIMNAKTKLDEIQASDDLLPDGWRWMLQLWSMPGEVWKDWIYITKSTVKSCKFGVFAARDFSSGTTIGYYTGPVVWTASMPGTEKPTNEYLALQNVPDTPYSLLMRNDKAEFVVVNPAPIDKEWSRPLYFGMHYIINISRCVREEDGAAGREKVHSNCTVLQDGSVVATRKITPHTEMFCTSIVDVSEERSGMEEVAENEKKERMKSAAKRSLVLNDTTERKKKRS